MPLTRTLVRTSLRQLFLASCLIALALFFGGCGKGAGGNSMQLKSPVTGDKDMPVKSGYAFAVTKTFTDTSGKISTAPSYRVYAANYDLDGGNFALTLNKPLTCDDQMRVVFSLVGDQGGNDKTAVKAGTYSAKAEKFMKVEDVAIVSRKAGTDNTGWLDRNTLTGDAKVTSVSGNTISGEIDLSSGTM